MVNRISSISESDQLADITENEFPNAKENATKQFPKLFSNRIGKFKGDPIKIHIKENVTPVIQPARRTPMDYIDQKKRRSEKCWKMTSLRDQLMWRCPVLISATLSSQTKKKRQDLCDT